MPCCCSIRVSISIELDNIRSTLFVSVIPYTSKCLGIYGAGRKIIRYSCCLQWNMNYYFLVLCLLFTVIHLDAVFSSYSHD